MAGADHHLIEEVLFYLVILLHVGVGNLGLGIGFPPEASWRRRRGRPPRSGPLLYRDQRVFSSLSPSSAEIECDAGVNLGWLRGGGVLARKLLHQHFINENAHHLHLLPRRWSSVSVTGLWPALFDGRVQIGFANNFAVDDGGRLCACRRRRRPWEGRRLGSARLTLAAEPASTAAPVRPASIHFRRLIRSPILRDSHETFR